MFRASIKDKSMVSMKARDAVATSIYRLVMGEIDTIEARSKVEVTAEEGAQIIRKLIKSNEETIGHLTDASERERLTREVVLLRELLPQGLSADAIAALLAPVADAIRAAAAEGQALGVAMKQIKTQGTRAESADVVAAVKLLRNGPAA
jgi:uncharacterized protein